MAAPSQRTAGAPGVTHPRVLFYKAANHRRVFGFGRSTQADETDESALGLDNLLQARAILVTEKYNKKLFTLMGFFLRTATQNLILRFLS